MSRKFYLSIIGIIVIFSIAEGAMWIFGASFAGFTVRSREAGYRYLPGIERAYINDDNLSLVHFASNKDGYRDDSWEQSKATKGVVIAVLGDSIVASLLTHKSRRFTEALERNLQTRGINAVVHNMGVNGQNVVNYLNAAQFAIAKLDPDILFVLVSSTDDFSPDNQSTFLGNRHVEYRIDGDTIVVTKRTLSSAEQTYRKLLRILRPIWSVRQMAKSINLIKNDLPHRIQSKLSSQSNEGQVISACSQWADLSVMHLDLVGVVLLDLARLAGDRLVLGLSPTIKELGDAHLKQRCPSDQTIKWFRKFTTENKLKRVDLFESLKQEDGNRLFLDGAHYTDFGHSELAEILSKNLFPLIGGVEHK